MAVFLVPGVSPKCEAVEISARAAVVYEPFSGTVLYEKNADEHMLIASTTKIMTALIVLENCALDEKVSVTAEHASVEGSSMYLEPGGDYTVEELLLGLMLASGNDAATALAEHTAGSMEKFAEMMNDKCAELGLHDTHFANAHGLDAEAHYSTARELAVITARAMENRDFCRIFSTERASVNGYSFKNHNRLLSICPGCIGGKTGYTEKAGRILVSCVQRDGMRLICVTISDPRDWDDHMNLYDEYFGEYEYIPVPNGKVPLVSGTQDSVEISGEVPGFVVEKSVGAQLRIHLPRFVFAPVCVGETLGWAELEPEGKQRMDIVATSEADRDEGQQPGGWEKFKRLWYKANSYGGIYSLQH